MQKIVVTGSLGLIGRALIEELKDISIIPLDIRYHNYINITDYNSVKQALSSCDGVVHLAAISRVVWGQIKPALCKEINVDGTKNIIQACLEASKKPWLIFASSREVYGQQETFPVKEDASLKPLNFYAQSKYDAENLILKAQEVGLKSAIVRFSSVFGGMADHYNRVIPIFCTSSLTNKPIYIEGSDCLFDFTYIADAVAGLKLLINLLCQEKKSVPTMHFTTGKPTSLQEVAELVTSLTNSNSELIIRPARNYDVTQFYGDYSRAKNILGWAPTYTLKESLIKFISDMKNLSRENKPYINGGFDEDLKSYTWLPASL